MPRIFRIAAKYADWMNHTKAVTLDSVRVRQEALDAACLARKRDPRSLKRSAFLSVVAGATARDVDALVADTARRTGQTAEEWRAERPAAIIGTPDHVAARLREYGLAGIDHVNALFPYGRELEIIEVLGRDVVAAVAEVRPG